MKTEEVKEILVEFQTQINDLLKMQLELNISFNSQAKQLNEDFHSVYEELYSMKKEDSKEFLESKRFMLDEMNKVTDKRTENIVNMFDERFECVHDNLAKIKALL